MLISLRSKWAGREALLRVRGGWTFCIARRVKTEQPRTSTPSGLTYRKRPVPSPERGPEFSPGFQPWVRRFNAMCPEGAPESGTPSRIDIMSERFCNLAPLSGRILRWQIPRVETLGCSLFALRAIRPPTRKCPNSRGARSLP
jgi:hypothetical protein